MDGDINGTNTITFEKKLLGGEKREEERAVKCESMGRASSLQPSVQMAPTMYSSHAACSFCAASLKQHCEERI